MPSRLLQAALAAAGALCLTACGDSTESSTPGGPSRAQIEALQALPYVAWDEAADTSKRGVVFHERSRASPGYNIYTDDRRRVYAMDLEGNRVHKWVLPPGMKHCELAEFLQDGDLVVVCTGHGLVVVDWDSNVRLRIDVRSIHHDIAETEDGTLVFPKSNAARDYVGRLVRFDSLRWVSATGETLDEWHTFDHLEQLQKLHPPSHLDDPTSALGDPDSPGGSGGREGARTRRTKPSYDYYHLNSVEVLPDTALGRSDSRFAAGNYLVSMRNTSLVIILDQRTKDIVWSWGPGEIDYQHMPTMLPSGNIMIFDNGLRRDYSRIIELNPASGEIEWEYRADPPSAFYSRYRGSNQVLPNGNILVCESEKGHVVEITREGDVVWDFWNPQMQRDKRRRIYRFSRVPLARLDGRLDRRRPSSSASSDG